ncbi:MAG: hypothetical protein LC789_11000 [Actinobacteria bacterium]|nr:hypothetical protein [Actinomycetota bacterium]MCA1722457.1 hypothetical protein [Actinomycetota bacterium]
MSKVDAMRALKDARLAEQRKAVVAARGLRPAARVSGPASRAEGEAGSATVAEGLCGHRNMSGRACTRSIGHAEKSHRYG